MPQSGSYQGFAHGNAKPKKAGKTALYCLLSSEYSSFFNILVIGFMIKWQGLAQNPRLPSVLQRLTMLKIR